MVINPSKILQQTLKDFESVSDHFGTLRIKELNKNTGFMPDCCAEYININPRGH